MSLYDDIDVFLPPSSSPPPKTREEEPPKKPETIVPKTEEKPPIISSNLSFLKAQLESKKAAQVQFKLKPPSVVPFSAKPQTVTEPPPAKKPATVSLLNPKRVQPLKIDATTTFSIIPKALREDNVFLFNEVEVADEYNPTAPTDYAMFKAKREVQLAREKAAKEIAERLEREHTEELAKRGRGAAFAPPPELMESSPIVEEKPTITEEPVSKQNVISNIMSRMGYRQGLGLGKNQQGISSALQIKKVGKTTGMIIAEETRDKRDFADATGAGPSEPLQPINITEQLKSAAKVILVTNMAIESDVDAELRNEITEEMSKYGQVVKIVIHVVENAPENEKVRIFVEFTNQAQAIKSVIDLNKRFFNGRAIRAVFYDVDDFVAEQYER